MFPDKKKVQRWLWQTLDFSGSMRLFSILFVPSIELFFSFRCCTSSIATSHNQWLTRGDHDIVAADNIRKLIKLALARLIDRLIPVDVDVAVILHTGTGGNQPTHDHVLLQPAQVIDATGNRRLGKYAGCLLKGCR